MCTARSDWKPRRPRKPVIRREWGRASHPSQLRGPTQEVSQPASTWQVGHLGREADIEEAAEKGEESLEKETEDRERTIEHGSSQRRFAKEEVVPFLITEAVAKEQPRRRRWRRGRL